ncbi:hypothetical protein I79_021307 [Cricetulus griseus]|uniref:Uncharacterized protein n=1 Tax=Cricetulus griseus TaxID=10029 RepID=G3ICB4_CRIGR|nr:hypothetical protein I79_021307 [Cricetulus griseus]
MSTKQLWSLNSLPFTPSVTTFPPDWGCYTCLRGIQSPPLCKQSRDSCCHTIRPTPYSRLVLVQTSDTQAQSSLSI